MDDAPPLELPRRRFRFDSMTFIMGFGLGIFLGVALGIVAFGLAWKQAEPTQQPAAVQVAPTETPNPLVTATPDRRPRTRAQLDVRLGPSSSYAAVGVISRGEAVSIVGRDVDAQWVSIQFPPGSNGRGWLPVSDLDTVGDLTTVAVTQATPLAQSLPTPQPNSITSSAGASIDRRPLDPEPTSTPRLSETTPTPRPATAPGGGTDMAVANVTRLSDGRVRVVVSNRGPGDVAGSTVFLVVRDLAVRTEQLIGPAQNIAAGSSITFTTSGLLITEDADIQAIVDPTASLRDPDRSNNAQTVLLRAPPTPEPTPQAGRDH